ncbi:hypothetical protein FAI40_08460 [Acetobacteraceae bacterium]|nr:hypothetical protein FAI40_08460 [Acetobacteraceae bacterium]
MNSPSQFQTSGKINNGLIRNGHHLIPFPYREVGRRGLGKYFSFCKRQVLDTILTHFVASADPDFLLLSHSAEISPIALKEVKVKYPRLKIAQWCGDALFEGKTVQKLQEKYPYCDATFVSTASSLTKKSLGEEKGIYFLPNPVDLSVEKERNFRKSFLPKDIFLSVGNEEDSREICGEAWKMKEFFAFLSKNLPHKTRFSLAGVGGEKYASGAAYDFLLKQAAIGLNLSRKGNERFYSSDRMSHIVGNGLLCAQERESSFNVFFSEEEMLFFSSKEELLEKLIYFMNHPQERQKVAQRGWQKYATFFNESAIADYLLKATLQILKPNEHSWHLLS